MAVAEIIGAAIGVMMLVIVAYVLVGGVLTAAEVVNNAQKDNTLQQEIRLGTDFKITTINQDTYSINISIQNTGNEVIRDFSHIDIFVNNNTAGYQYLTIDDLPDNIRTKQLGPNKTTWIKAIFNSSFTAQEVVVVTGNGVFRQWGI